MVTLRSCLPCSNGRWKFAWVPVSWYMGIMLSLDTEYVVTYLAKAAWLAPTFCFSQAGCWLEEGHRIRWAFSCPISVINCNDFRRDVKRIPQGLTSHWFPHQCTKGSKKQLSWRLTPSGLHLLPPGWVCSSKAPLRSLRNTCMQVAAKSEFISALPRMKRGACLRMAERKVRKRGLSAARKVLLYLPRTNRTRKYLAEFTIIQTLSQTLIAGTGNRVPGRREVDHVCVLHLLPAETGTFQARCCWALLLSSSKISLIKGLIIPILERTYSLYLQLLSNSLPLVFMNYTFIFHCHITDLFCLSLWCVWKLETKGIGETWV